MELPKIKCKYFKLKKEMILDIGDPADCGSSELPSMLFFLCFQHGRPRSFRHVQEDSSRMWAHRHHQLIHYSFVPDSCCRVRHLHVHTIFVEFSSTSSWRSGRGCWAFSCRSNKETETRVSFIEPGCFTAEGPNRTRTNPEVFCWSHLPSVSLHWMSSCSRRPEAFCWWTERLLNVLITRWGSIRVWAALYNDTWTQPSKQLKSWTHSLGWTSCRVRCGTFWEVKGCPPVHQRLCQSTTSPFPQNSHLFTLTVNRRGWNKNLLMDRVELQFITNLQTRRRLCQECCRASWWWAPAALTCGRAIVTAASWTTCCRRI